MEKNLLGDEDPEEFAKEVAKEVAWKGIAASLAIQPTTKPVDEVTALSDIPAP